MTVYCRIPFPYALRDGGEGSVALQFGAGGTSCLSRINFSSGQGDLRKTGGPYTRRRVSTNDWEVVTVRHLIRPCHRNDYTTTLVVSRKSCTGTSWSRFVGRSGTREGHVPPSLDFNLLISNCRL